MSKQPVVTQLRDAEGVTRVNSFNIKPALIGIEKDWNYRDYTLRSNLDHVAELKESIRELGVQQPLWVRMDAGKIVLVAGECRLRAVMELIEEGHPIKTIPAIHKDKSPEERLVLALTENTGKPPSKWEIGKGYQRLLDFGWTVEQVAKKMGQNTAFVKEAVELSTADQGTRDLLDQAAVSPSLAKWAIRHHGDQASLVLKQKVEASEKKKAEKPAAKKKTSTPAKQKPVGREKKSNGVFVPFKTLQMIYDLFKSINEVLLQSPEVYEMSETGQDAALKLLAKKEDK